MDGQNADAPETEAATPEAAQPSTLSGQLDALLKAKGEMDFPSATAEGPPEWGELPPGLKPAPGTAVGFLRFKAAWTRTPLAGDRVCVVWPLTDMDEKLAYARAQDSMAAAAGELAKQMIRAVDGVKVDWSAKSGSPGNIDDWWANIGPKCRQMVMRYYSRTHLMAPDEVADFLENCVAVRTVG